MILVKSPSMHHPTASSVLALRTGLRPGRALVRPASSSASLSLPGVARAKRNAGSHRRHEVLLPAVAAVALLPHNASGVASLATLLLLLLLLLAAVQRRMQGNHQRAGRATWRHLNLPCLHGLQAPPLLMRAARRSGRSSCPISGRHSIPPMVPRLAPQSTRSGCRVTMVAVTAIVPCLTVTLMPSGAVLLRSLAMVLVQRSRVSHLASHTHCATPAAAWCTHLGQHPLWMPAALPPPLPLLVVAHLQKTATACRCHKGLQAPLWWRMRTAL